MRESDLLMIDRYFFTSINRAVFESIDLMTTRRIGMFSHCGKNEIRFVSWGSRNRANVRVGRAINRTSGPSIVSSRTEEELK